MNTAKKIIRSDEQGVVHVDVPVGSPGQSVDILVVWQVIGDDRPAVGPDSSGEPMTQDTSEEAWMAQFVGVLEPGDLERAPQGEIETRRSFE